TFLVVERFAVLAVGDEDDLVGHRRVHLGQGEDDPVAVGGLGHQAVRQQGPFQPLPQGDPGGQKHVGQRRPLVGRRRAVPLDPGLVPREPGQVSGGKGGCLPPFVLDRQRGRLFAGQEPPRRRREKEQDRDAPHGVLLGRRPAGGPGRWGSALLWYS